MKLSLIIPTLNEEEHITTLVDFLRAHCDDRLLEIIVVDGRSTDRTTEICRKLPLQLFLSEVAERAVQMNLGASKAQGDVFYFVHSDTLPPSSFLDDIEQQLKNGYDCGCYRFKFDSKKRMLALNSWFTRFNTMGVRGGDQTLFFSRELFEKVGGYDETFVIMEEYDLLKRVKRAGGRFVLIPKDVQVSDRKYHENSYLRVNLANAVAMSMWKFGCEPQKIKSTYHRLIHHPKDV